MIHARHAIALLLVALATGVGDAQAQYPTRPIRWIVPYTPGGLTDSVTRIVTQRMQEGLGQPIVVENRPGANSIVGADLGAKASPDGHTMLTVIAAHSANATLYAGKLPYDTVKSFVPTSLVAIAPRGGKVRALGMFAAKRVPGAQEVPTLAEAGGPPIESSTWVMFLAPAGTPHDVVAHLVAETAKAVTSVELRGRFEQLGLEDVGSTPEQALAFLDDEIRKWAKVITTA